MMRAGAHVLVLPQVRDPLRDVWAEYSSAWRTRFATDALMGSELRYHDGLEERPLPWSD
jgi:hypothetical protein